MKRFFSIFFILTCLVCCGLFYGCGDKYANLTFSIEVSYDGATKVEDLDNGYKRVTLKNGGAFDDHLDGSYTFYIVSDTNTKTTATVQATFEGTPNDFNYQVTHSLSTEILSVSNNVIPTSSGLKREITANSKGRTELTFINVESGKRDKVVIDVVEVASSMAFIDKSLAIVGAEGSTLTLNNEVILLTPETSSLTNISYSIGELDKDNIFISWSDSQLLANGLRFNRRTSVLDVFDIRNLNKKNFYVMATYDNPVGDNLTAITKVNVVNALTNFEIYNGTSAKDAKVPENLITSGDINDLIVNIEGLSDKDIILKVRSNGEEVNFNYLRDSDLPVYFPNSNFTTQYFAQDGETLSIYDAETNGYYKNATYCLCFIKVCSSTKTTLNDRYPSGTYAVKFSCEYNNYKVDNYPLINDFVVKNDNLITSFSINGDVVENFSIVENPNKTPYDSEVYINSSGDVDGTPFNINVGNTDSILQANKKFTLSLFKYNPITLQCEEITSSLSRYFTVKKGVGQSTNLVNVIDNFAGVYDCNSTFYFVPNVIQEDNVKLGDIFYLVVTAEKPFDREDKQAKASIKMNVVQGVEAFNNFDYSYSQYKVDSTTGEYVIDPVTGEKVVESFSGKMSFDDSLVSKDNINLDLSSGFNATVILNYLPAGASLNNITITSSNEKVLEIKRNENEKNVFYITAHGIGQEFVYITVSHLKDVKYAIAVNVYNPISNFNIRLNSTSVSAGIGKYTVNEENDIVSSVVQVRKQIYLNLSTTPVTSNQFSIEFSAYLGSLNGGTLLRSYSIDYKGEASSSVNIIGDADLMFTCASDGNKNACSFIFRTDNSVGKLYTIVIKLTNLDGSVITKSFEIESYVPIKTIKTDVTSRLVYNPNTISYLSKSQDINDPSVFGLKIQTLADSKDSEPTYTFKNNGRILIFVNNIQQMVFNCSNGRLVTNSSDENSLLNLINEYPDGEGYYWFKLNENYDFSNVVGSIFYSIQIEQLGMWFTQTNSFRTVDAENVSTLVTYTDEQLYYKQGYSQDKQIDIQVVKDTSFNKNLLVKTYDMFTIDGRNFYYDLVGNDSNNISSVSEAIIEPGKTSSQFNLKVAPNVAGKSVIIVMPEDKIITKNDYDIFTQKVYKQVAISKEEFIDGIFYTKHGADYILATEFVEGTNYYAYTTNLNKVIELWTHCLVFYMTVADGVKIPYQISSYDELKEISLNEDSVIKRYVLTKDILVNSTENWESIGNYYLVGKVSQDEFSNSNLYIYDGQTYLEATTYSSEEVYYAYGFNGELSGKYSYENVKTNQIVDSFYKVSGISFEGIENKNYSGFISNIGLAGRVLDMTVGYGVFRPSINDTYTFGGISVTNNGYIENCITSFDNFTITTSYKTTIGGLVGENKGRIVNDKLSNVGLSGTVRLVAQNINSNYVIGGLVGINRGEILGSVVTDKDVEFTFNDAGFNSNLNIIADIDVDVQGYITNSSIGGAVGTNYGLLKNVSIKGSINAPKYNYVGGLVGSAEYDKDYNAEDVYSIDSSYSIANVSGNDFVGGAIGSINGVNSTSTINLNYVSAENYATSSNYARIFVNGRDNVGGFAGNSAFANIQYCYVVSYFDCMPLVDTKVEEVGYDIVGNNVGGFIGLSSNTSIKNSSSFVNVRGEETADLFILQPNNSTMNISDVFVIGYGYANNGISHNLINPNIQGYYYYIASDTKANAVTIRDSISPNQNITAEQIISNFTATNGWEIDSRTNSGLPYLTITFSSGRIEPLFATTPINVSAIVKSDEKEFISYIRDKDNSLIMFFNYDYLTRYLAEDINKLNIVSFLDFINLYVLPTTSKSARLDIATSNSKVISINSNGTLKIMGEGKVTLTISSKLNANYKAEIFIVVKYGVREVNVYDNISANISLNGRDIELLKSRTQTLFVEVDYYRDLEHEKDAKLKSSNDVGIRFRVASGVSEEDANNGITSLDKILEDLDEVDINSLFKFNGDTWLYDGEYWYVDISSGRNPVITPLIAMAENHKLKIEYIPYIKSIFNTIESTIMLEKFSGSFTLSLIKGATDIILENNIDVSQSVEISQLETHTFTVTLFTDYEFDEILDNFSIANADNLLSIVKSNITYNYTDDTNKTLESISATYTINYKDKLNAVENDLLYMFEFWAVSDPTIKTSLKFVIVSQDKINQVYGTMYTKISDFPQNPNKNSVIYNGQVGVLSIEVYPYFSNYNSMRVYYRNPSSYPLLVTQLSYDITGASGQFLTNYPDSGSILDMSDIMKVEKSSGQDSYLLNTNGTYSYSKIYFFSLLAGTDVPDKTNFTFYVEFLNRDGTIIETYTYNFTTIVQPSITYTFDEKLKGSNDLYYLPINTKQNMKINLVNYEGDITWNVSSKDHILTQNEKDVLTPYKNDEGEYELRVFKYDGNMSADNVLSTNCIGKHFTITATIRDNERTYSFSQTFVVTLFTVTGVTAQNVSNGYMTIPMSTTTPLLVNLDVLYDESLVNTADGDNWYSRWYKYHGETNDASDMLYKYLTACGYEIERYFSRYFIQLSNAIAKASYNYKENSASTKVSGVWFYDSNNNDSGYLQVSKDYNNSTFGVEQYNEYIAVYGYQIDRNSKISLRTNISYTNNEGGGNKLVEVNGIPNVYHYSISMIDSTFDTTFKFEDNFILNFIYKSDLINAIPISTPEEFLNMQEGFDYRLVNDIELSNYTPISTAIASLDGNNYNIYITSFGYDSSYDDKCVLGLFDNVSEKSLLCNVTVYFTDRIINTNGATRLVPSSSPLNVTQLYVKSMTFGGIAGTNDGVLTNCKVTGKLNIVLNNNVNVGTIPQALNGGLVATNSVTGYITNSSIFNFDFSCYGITGGVVGINNGKIVSTFLNESSIINESSDVTAGFVYNNSATINECYVQGYRANNDNDIRNTGLGIVAKGDVGGFAYNNSGKISDCYSNISLQSSSTLAGFVYGETSSSEISRCYSISYKSSSDNSRIASPFAGTNSADYKITINGVLNNCYYLTGETWTNVQWASTNEQKTAKKLTLDEFSTHTNFVSFDLSLVYNDDLTYADSEETYSYVDGYTWVIIEGKPVIVSTLIKTISQCEYLGKTKNYKKDIYTYYDEKQVVNFVSSTPVNIGLDRIRTNYYSNPKGLDIPYLTENELIFYTIQDNRKNTFTYYFSKKKGSNENSETIEKANTTEKNEAITIVFKIDLENGEIKSKKLISAQYGTEVLDVSYQEGSSHIEDNNFRANDTIELEFNDKGIISHIDYKELENASYYYSSSSQNTAPKGARTNPKIINDYKSFEYYLKENTAGNFYRIIKDIDFIGKEGYFLPKTVYSNFQGCLQGNYMSLNEISISYVNYLNGNITPGDDFIVDDQEAFGLFSSISTVPDIKNFNTVISNLSLNIVEVLSNTHERVGALAGIIHTDKTKNTGTKLILNNININGMDSRNAYIQGKNVAGGLAGIILGDVIIKDITVSANVNATKDVSSGNVKNVLYTENKDIKNIAYAGGVAGILDCNEVIDDSTQRKYNASNIHTYGNVHITGGVVGMVFGLVGRDSIVNYANVDIANTPNNYIEASVYAGGLVGENRGKIYSSSVSYRELESYSSVKVASSNLIENLLFRSSAGSDSAVASGGLVGLNNGGLLSNSISTVDVRDNNTKISGGAVGRMITGTLENVIATGSVMSKGIIGGLIGTANDSMLVIKSGYSEEAIATTSVDGEEKTIIRNCVAANNWLAIDYWQYEYLLINNNPIGGFIGLIANSASKDNFIEFDNFNFYTNTLYTSTNAVTPQKYLKVAYFSNTMDIIADVRTGIKSILTGTDGSQAVFPYSTREAYYEDTNTNISYTMKETENKGGDKIGTPCVDYIFDLIKWNVENPEDFYVKIDFTDTFWIDNGIEWTISNIPKDYDEYIQHFGIIYIKNDIGVFEKIGSESQFKIYYEQENRDLYYIRYRRLQKFVKTTQYPTNGINDVVINTSRSTGSKVNNEYTFKSFEDLQNITSVYINGLEINNLGDITESTGNADTIDYRMVYGNIDFSLPNNTRIIKLSINVTQKELHLDNTENTQRCWEVSSIDITYEYDTSKNYISVRTPNGSNLNYTYLLDLSSKQVIYNSFIGNGYWKVPDNFFKNAAYDEADKYLINLEYADVYLWNTFASEEWTEEEINSGNLTISTPEQLAMFANMVNAGNGFVGKTITLENDVDLSGKFWVPIGSEENAFEGTFNGNGHTIKYTTVNEISNELTGSIGGLFGYVRNASIINLSTFGGDIYGVTAGGIIAIAEGTTNVENVLNRNNVTAEETGGGIIGKIITTNRVQTINIIDSVNYGDIDHLNIDFNQNQQINLGGVIGHIESDVTNYMFSGLTNFGDISAVNTSTNYSSSSIKIELNVSGIVGDIDLIGNNFINLNNYGNITINSNAHLLNVGGIVGITQKQTQVVDSKNYATISIVYNNIYSVGLSNINTASAFVGGIVGWAKDDIINCGNEGKIDFNLSTTSSSFISIGGVVGSTSANIERSYNANNIEVYTITRRTASVIVGGVAGGTNITRGSREINDCYNSGDIQVTSSSWLYVGGIVGASYYEDVSSGREIIFRNIRTENKLSVNTSLNVGYISIVAIEKFYNGLGAIAGYANFNMQFTSNYYLRDSAYSGNTIYKAYCLLDENKTDEEGKDFYTEDGDSNYPKLITSLKNKNTYDSEWNFVNEETGEGVWQQFYDTWYPSLKDNNASSMWSDKQEEVAQENGSFVVKSAEELAYLSSAINSGELDTTNITIRLINFIDLSNRYWTPIGTLDNPFKGTFDGNGYVIRNLTIDGAFIENKEFGGLFGVCENATINDVGLENTIVQNVSYASGLVYQAKNTRISRIYTDGAEESLDAVISGIKGAGGIVYNALNCSSVETDDITKGIYYSFNNLPIKTTGVSSEVVATGGLVGNLENSSISNSYNNVNGNIFTTALYEGSNPRDCGNVIAGIAKGNCSLINVFNLASNFVDGSGATAEIDPRIYCVKENGEYLRIILPTGNAEEDKPLFENLIDDNNNLSSIWTQENEYTLNKPVKGVYYPSIRGLGGNWKNTESEALVAINYENVEDIAIYVQRYIDDGIITETMVSLYKDKNSDSIGYKKTYYLVATEEELAWVSSNVNNGSLLTANAEFILLNDLDLSGKYWTPIGSTSVYQFQGIFNMNGHRIKGLTIDSSVLNYGGLFGYTNGAKIVNGDITDSFIKIVSSSNQTNVYAGAIVGRGINTSIENVYVSTAISVTSNSAIFVGGAIGSMTGQDYILNNVYVEKTYNKKEGSTSTKYARYIDIKPYYNQVVEKRNAEGKPEGVIDSDDKSKIGLGAFSEGGNVYIGGVAGYVAGKTINDDGNINIDNIPNTIECAFSDVNIAGVTKSNASRSYAGGVVGYALETVKFESVKSSGIVKTFTNQYDFVGGIVGYMNNSYISNAYFNGYLEPCQDFDNHIISRLGGIVAMIETNGILSRCVNNGRMTANSKYENNAHVGGIIGFSRGRGFSKDEYLIYNSQNYICDAIGYYETSGIAENPEEEINRAYSSQFSNISASNGFKPLIWKNGELISNSILIKGNGSNLIVISADGVNVNKELSEDGITVRDFSSVTLGYANGSNVQGDELVIAGRDVNGDYFYKKVSITSNTFNLKSVISSALIDNDINANKILYCFVELIQVT